MRRLKGRTPPEGWDQLEATVEDYERQMRDAVAEDHEGKRRNETTWRIHRLHFEKNRFIYDLMYKRKALSRELARPRRRRPGAPPPRRRTGESGCVGRAGSGGLPASGGAHGPRLTRSPRPPQFDYLVREKIADNGLIAKWRKPGYENLCSLLAIQKARTEGVAQPSLSHSLCALYRHLTRTPKSDTSFGTTSLCRVPIANRSGHQTFAPDVKTGCISCCSGDGVAGGPLWWNTPVDAEHFARKAEKGGGGGGRKRGAGAGGGGAERDDEEAVRRRVADLAAQPGAGVD